MSKAAFLDRDGTINRKPPEGQYVTCREEMHLLPDAARAIALLNRAGFRVIVVSNQRCVAKGLVTEIALEAIHQRMCEELNSKGARVDEIYYCPHEKHPPCTCRKPAPGLLLAAARAHDIDLTGSWMIGDSDVDVQAGINAGCKTARILNNHDSAAIDSDLNGATLLEAVEKILNWSRTPGAAALEQLSLP
jgi:D-glycero-D-manno-heptose 1,7-bisphosphate phosphatase